jgi:hypothetical protein
MADPFSWTPVAHVALPAQDGTTSVKRALSLRDTTFMSTEQPAYYRDSVLEVTKIRAGATGPVALV